MRLSSCALKTDKRAPKNAKLASHALMHRGGLGREIAPGEFARLGVWPAILQKLVDVFAGELGPPRPVPVDLGPRCSDAGAWGRLFPQLVASIKELPSAAYAMGWAAHDAAKPRAGILSAKERSVADVYLFTETEDAASERAKSIRAAADRLVALCGLDVREIAAPDGTMLVQPLDDASFTFLACDACDLAGVPSAISSRIEEFGQDAEVKPMEEVHGPFLVQVEPLAEFIGIPVWKTTKTLLFDADGKVVAVMLRGDCDADEEKIRRFLGCTEMRLVSEERIESLTGAVVGYAGVVGLPKSVRVIADEYTRGRVNFECGANKTDYHLINVNFERDCPLPEFGDFKLSRTGHRCPSCDDGHLVEARGIPLVELLGVTNAPGGVELACIGRDGKPQPAAAASVRLRLEEIAAACIERNHDEAGIVWPKAVAPFAVHLVALNVNVPEVVDAASAVCRELTDSGLSVLYDDRDTKPGAKFADADLLGLPVQVTISKRTMESGSLEVKPRAGGERQTLPRDEAIALARGAAEAIDMGGTR
jgi:prolyl-tRNA synthetase